VRVVIVCSCNVISDHQVRTVTADHAVRATSEVYRCLGCTAACGRCVRTIRNIMDEVHAGVDVCGERTIAVPSRPSFGAAPEPSVACPALEPILFAAE
jgi:bacterioferritin-associated ferredoxin